MQVNAILPVSGYVRGMPKKKGRPGSPIGQPKPPKRKLDPQFAKRMRETMKSFEPPLSPAALARKAGCSRMTIGNYLRGKMNVDALTLFAVADALDVSPRWLLTGQGLPGKGRPLDVQQHRTLEVYEMLTPEWRDYWLDQGEQITTRKLNS